MTKHIALQPAAVLAVVIEARVDGPHVDIMVDKEWWAGASKDHRKAAFIAAVEALGRAGMRIIPEEYDEADLVAHPDLPEVPPIPDDADPL